MAYNVVIAADFGVANTGKTVHGKLFGADGSQVGSTITAGFVEAVAGLYIYVLSAPDGQEGVFVAYDSANAALRRSVVIAPRETENSDVKSSTLATPGNVSDTQTAITNAIAALNNLSQSQAQTAAAAALVAYDPPTKVELDTAQTAIIDAVPTAAETADIVLSRGMAHIDLAAEENSIYELIQAIFQSSTVTGEWVIKKTDGVTTFNTRTLTTDPNALPITGVA